MERDDYKKVTVETVVTGCDGREVARLEGKVQPCGGDYADALPIAFRWEKTTRELLGSGRVEKN